MRLSHRLTAVQQTHQPPELNILVRLSQHGLRILLRLHPVPAKRLLFLKRSHFVSGIQIKLECLHVNRTEFICDRCDILIRQRACDCVVVLHQPEELTIDRKPLTQRDVLLSACQAMAQLHHQRLNLFHLVVGHNTI